MNATIPINALINILRKHLQPPTPAGAVLGGFIFHVFAKGDLRVDTERGFFMLLLAEKGPQDMISVLGGSGTAIGHY